MLTIKISDAVAAAIATKGKFGETHDDVLRRVLNIAPVKGPGHLFVSGPRGRGKTRHAEKRLSNNMVRDERFVVELEGSLTKEWRLPAKTDTPAIKRLRDAASVYAREHGATQGQINAIGKALQQAGYYVRGPRTPRVTAADLADRI